jgi:pyridoxine 5-phosphate synthase
MDARFVLQLDPVDRIRGLRGGRDPDPGTVALLAQLAGVHGVSMTVREERRSHASRELGLLREMVRTHLELRLAPTADLVSLAFDVRPDRVTLVADRRDGDGGAGPLDVQLLKDALRKQIQNLRDVDVEIACLVAADLDQVKAVHKVDADVVVLQTSAYSASTSAQDRRAELTRIADAAGLAARLGLKVSVGGGLDLVSVEEVARLAHVTEFQVGHACIARGLLVGIERAVRDFLAAIERGRQRPQ